MSRQVQFCERVLQRVEALPGVKVASTASFVPLTDNSSSMVFTLTTGRFRRRVSLPKRSTEIVSPGYFQAMGIPLLKGRVFDASDGRMPPMKRDMGTMLAWWRKADFKVVVSETMARTYWPNQDPIGKTFRPGFPDMKGPAVTVIGVVGDTKHWGLGSAPTMEFYDSAYLFPSFGQHLVLRTAGDPLTLAQAVRTAVREVDPSAVVSDVRTMEAVVSKSVSGGDEYRSAGDVCGLGAVARRRRNLWRDGVPGGPETPRNRYSHGAWGRHFEGHAIRAAGGAGALRRGHRHRWSDKLCARPADCEHALRRSVDRCAHLQRRRGTAAGGNRGGQLSAGSPGDPGRSRHRPAERVKSYFFSGAFSGAFSGCFTGLAKIESSTGALISIFSTVSEKAGLPFAD